ncbi:hypothetical protein HZA75_05135 [Candidatus Roizmanbacteria bacterium]|nr:hypothetical protein [Candidatus Roizmanbacteria bacterium]
MIEPNINTFRSFKEKLEQELQPNQVVREGGPGFTVFGLSFGYKNSLGNDAIQFSKGGGCINIAVVDGTLSGDSDQPKYLSPERIEAEVLTRKLLETPLSDVDLNKILASAKSSIEQAVPKEYKLAHLTPPFAVINFTPEKLDLLGNGDTTILAFKPKEGEDFEVQLLHHDSVFTISYPNDNDSRAVSSRSRTELVKSNLNFPEGTFFLLCTDGGLEILADKLSINIDTLKYDYSLASDNFSYLRIIDDESAPLEKRQQATQAFFQPLIEILKIKFKVGNSLNEALKSLMQDIENDLIKDRLRQTDDATIVFLQKEKFPTLINLEKISANLRPLLRVLQSTDLPEDTNQLVNKYTKEYCIKLVEELTDIDVPPCNLFANACALVKYDELSPKTQEWFRKKGLLILEGENIIVNLKHKEDANFMMQPCHEIGQVLLFGIPAGQHKRMDIAPTKVAKNSFSPHYVSDRLPRGACATVNAWRDWHATVSGTYIAGTGPNARGILIPAGEQPVVYWHTENSYKEGQDKRNFYVSQAAPSFDSQIAWYAMMGLGKYLTGKIPAV